MRWRALIGALALVVSACSGAADTTETAPVAPGGNGATQQSTTTQQSDTGAVDTAPEATIADSGGAGGEAQASVTVGDQTYDIPIDLANGIHRCDTDFYGSFWVIGDGLEMLLIPDDSAVAGTDSSYLKVRDLSADVEWVADPDANVDMDPKVPEGNSQVDDFTIDGRHASGSATFVEQNAVFAWIGGGDEPEPVKGTFDVTCPES